MAEQKQEETSFLAAVSHILLFLGDFFSEVFYEERKVRITSFSNPVSVPMILSKIKLTPSSLLNGALDAAFFDIKARFQLFGDAMNTGKTINESSIVEYVFSQANTDDCMIVLCSCLS